MSTFTQTLCRRAVVLATGLLLSAASSADLLEHTDDNLHASGHDRSEPVAASMVRPSEDKANYRREKALLATGQFITPVALKGAKQQWLNPRLASYPDFVAGEAVRSQLSPDGNTLAILTAGQNSLYKSDGTVDVANSTQYIFLYDVSGANRASPQLKQVITQRNAHVGMVFSPDGSKLYVAGGADDLVYVYTQAAGGWIAAAPIALGHADKGVGVRVRTSTSSSLNAHRS